MRKTIVLLCDGMADLPIEEHQGLTPLQIAHTPVMDKLAQHGVCGMVQTVPANQTPGSDVANLSILGYDPDIYYTGRAPLETAGLGVSLSEDDAVFRCNLVTLSPTKIMLDSCGGITKPDDSISLCQKLQTLNNDTLTFLPGDGYRHLLLWHHAPSMLDDPTPPHELYGKKVGAHLPRHPELLTWMQKANAICASTPGNANAVWLWGSGRRTVLPPFEAHAGCKGTIITGTTLIRGIGRLAQMDTPRIPGATGDLDTNWDGKIHAALAALSQTPYVFLHLNAPDECGHRGNLAQKIEAIEKIDRVAGRLWEALGQLQEEYQFLLLPDHATPVSLRGHSAAPVPFILYRPNGVHGYEMPSFHERMPVTLSLSSALDLMRLLKDSYSLSSIKIPQG
jgi:2,3-bisphosphoglycerate-independent phosphoglycerate mutase